MRDTLGKASHATMVPSGLLKRNSASKAKSLELKEKGDLSELSKRELLKLDRYFTGKRFIEVPRLDPQDPFSALAFKCIILRAERVKKDLKRFSHSTFDAHFFNSFTLTDKASYFLAQLDTLSRANFLLIRSKLVSEIEKILEGEIKRISRLLQKREMNTSLVDAISSQHSKVEQDIIIHVSSGLPCVIEMLGINNLDNTSISDVAKSLENVHSGSKVLDALAPSSPIFDSGFIEISSSGIVDAEVWEKVSLKFNNLNSMRNRESKQSLGWFEWQKSYKPTKKLGDVYLPERSKNVIELLIEDYKRNSADKRMVFVFRGPPGTGKTMTSEAIAESLGMNVLRIQTGEIESKNLPNIVTYAMARAKNGRQMLLFEECEHLLWKSFFLEIASPWMKTLFEDFRGVACFTTNYEIPTDFLRRATFSTKFTAPSGKVRAKILENEISQAISKHQYGLQVNPQEIKEIASQYNIPGGFFGQVLHLAGAMTPNSKLNASALTEAFKIVENQLLEGKSKSGPQDPKVNISELKICSDSTLKINRFIKYCESSPGEFNRSNWAPKTILFSGPPGTGKTMAAEAIAKALGKKIFRVSPSHLLGKYVGETEKKIRDLFSSATVEDHIIFLDEAEGLLIDRQASTASWERTQADEFLQQIESFSGILIAATNWTAMIDPAYARRFVFHVEFKVPDSSVRLLIWEKFSQLLPNEIESAELAEKFELSGGEIRNVAIKAKAFDLQTQVQIEKLCEQQMNERTGFVVKRIGIK